MREIDQHPAQFTRKCKVNDTSFFAAVPRGALFFPHCPEVQPGMIILIDHSHHALDSIALILSQPLPEI